MRKWAVVLMVLACSVLAFGQKPDVKKDAENLYQSFVTKVKGGDTNVDFAAFRVAYSQTKAYSPYGGAGQQKDLFAALDQKNYKDALKKAQKILDDCYVDMDAHVVASLAYRGLNDSTNADFHKAVYLGLVNSIISSGDGKTAKTAYVVISTHEEYVVLRALGLSPGSQSLVHQDGHSFDVLLATDGKTGSSVTIYFNIDISWKAETDMFK